MQKHEDTVQNLNGNVMVGATIQVMVAFTTTPATIFSDPAGQVPIDLLLTDNLGQFGFYAPNGRYDLFAIINGNRVAHDSDVLLFDPEDDERITGGGSGGGTGTGGSGSGSGANEAEVALIPDSSGNLTISKTAGINYAVTLAANAKLLNPVGYAAGDRIKIIARQDATGARVMSFDTLYAVPNAQVPVLSTAANAIDKMEIDVTAGANGLEYVLTPYFNNYSTVQPLARIGSTLYYMLGGAAGQGAFNKILPGQTCYIIRNGTGPETTATIMGAADDSNPSYVVAGAPVNGERPLLTMLPDTRPAFGKAVLNFERSGTIEYRDLRITGARNTDSDAIGIMFNQSGNDAAPDVTHMTIRNVEITNCNNGILTGNTSSHGSLALYDVLLDNNGIGGTDASNSHGTGTSNGFVHNIYVGEMQGTATALRMTSTGCQTGHNFKTRADNTDLQQLLTSGSLTGYELNAPNGGTLTVSNSSFHKIGSCTQGILISIGEEGIITTRPRKYKFTNCLFQNDLMGGGRDIPFFVNFDTDVAMEFVDCQFVGADALALSNDPGGQQKYAGMSTVNGIRYWPNVAPVFTLTGGPLGPILTPGYFPVAMTPVVG